MLGPWNVPTPVVHDAADVPEGDYGELPGLLQPDESSWMAVHYSETRDGRILVR